MTILCGSDMEASYGSMQILHRCTISAHSGEIAVVVGPNGAGKSTAMKALLGIVPLSHGSVMLNETDITHLSVQQKILLGLSFVPQTDNIFPQLNVRENLEMGGFSCPEDSEKTIAEIYQIFPILRQKAEQKAGELSGGQRQQVAFGRALMSKPSVILLDEPTAGVSPIVITDIFRNILTLKELGMAVLMVEQNAKQALEIADVGFVLVSGHNEYSGKGSELLANKDVRQAFLGG